MVGRFAAAWRAGVASLVLLCAAVAPAASAAPRPAYVTSGAPAARESASHGCATPGGRDRIVAELPAPPGGWNGHPQAVLLMNAFEGDVVIRHRDRVRCGRLQDARTLDSRFRVGMGTVLVPEAGDRTPIRLEFIRQPLPLWQPIVRLGEPAQVQREDTGRFALRVAAIAVMLTLVLSSLLTYLASREKAFMGYALSASGVVLWLALLSGLWAYPQPWLPAGERLLWLLLALPTAIAGITLRTMIKQAALHRVAPWTDRASRWAMYAICVLALLILALPRAALATASIAVEVGFYGLCAAMAAAAVYAAARGFGRVRAIATLACVLPFLGLALAQWLAPDELALWKVELLMLCSGWLALTTSMMLTLRLGSLRQQRDEMRALAQTDALTGLANRRAALERLAQTISEARAQQLPLAVAFLDVDHFKRINDRHGHDAGDRVLARVAQTLRATVDSGDDVARMGGEEFLIVLPGATAALARDRIERARQRLTAIAPRLGLDDLRVTASAGVAELAAGEDMAGLLQRADAAMYAAKRGGRDRVEMAPAADTTRQTPAPA